MEPTPVSVEAQLSMASAVMEAVEAVLDGKEVSDFMESFPIVRRVLDMRSERDGLRAIFRITR